MADLFDYDAELRLYNEHFRAAARVGPHDRVLDVGCGTGLSTREAARAAVGGSAVGVDISAPMLERARRALTAAAATRRGPDAFSLADPAVTEGVLVAAGFVDVTFTDVHEPVYYGPDGATALDAVLRLLKFEDLLTDLDPAAAGRARARLRRTLDEHHTDGGVLFDSRAWIVTAHRRH